MKRRSGFTVMARLIGLVRPLTGFMILAIAMGLTGHLLAAFITILGGYAVLNILNFDVTISLTAVFVCVAVFAVFRAVLRYAEQACKQCQTGILKSIYYSKISAHVRQWIPGHEELIPQLMLRLNPGGALAVQIPMNSEEPLFRIIKDTAAESKWNF